MTAPSPRDREIADTLLLELRDEIAMARHAARQRQERENNG